MNYAESLAYWYFRLNGFFPITNFVLHQPKGRGQSADCDVLAIRLPNTRETIANDDENLVQCDEGLFDGCDLDLAKDTIGAIVQVKSGIYSTSDICKSFQDCNLLYSCHRLGMFSTNDIPGVADELANQKVVRRGKHVVVKVLVSSAECLDELRDEVWHVRLDDIVKFIENRFRAYHRHKRGARMFFHDPIVQYLAWQSRS